MDIREFDRLLWEYDKVVQAHHDLCYRRGAHDTEARQKAVKKGALRIEIVQAYKRLLETDR